MNRMIFGLPLLIALATVIGLFAALTGDGWRDALSWIGLATPLVAIGWAYRTRRC